ncbi:hypothetical protein G7084_02935 [Weissella coleopterorum]|uniref:Uncharacterized protein n=1 Tax=Weissella coleopterorum TaxID=2714949 RepID=A0A6G8AZ72_9LACO|nr:hypothetical protein [Weissella coleopterorum]QIL50364.1 hypothetical protein G7084_02935 [Weissella coleopterorum]
MTIKFSKTVWVLNIMQAIIFLAGFLSNTAYTTIDKIKWFDIYSLSNFAGIMYWSVVSMVSIIGFVFSLYIVINNKIAKDSMMGMILSMVGFASPILFSFFLVIPSTVLIMAAIFNRNIKLMNLE